MNLSFKGKTILVGGATDGIGWACVKQFSALGANIILLGRNEQKLSQRLDDISNVEGSLFTLSVDFTKPDELEDKLRKFISENNLQIDVVVNNTGGPAGGPLEKASTSELLHAFNMHLISYHKIFGLVKDIMISRPYGRIINIISTSVKQPLNGLGVSNTIRGAVANWSKTLSNELAIHNITVNNVLPGATNTGRLNEIIKNKAAKLNLKEQEVKNSMAQEVPMKRIAEPEEVANAVVFLASDYASYINGINLTVDGGRTKSL